MLIALVKIIHTASSSTSIIVLEALVSSTTKFRVTFCNKSSMNAETSNIIAGFAGDLFDSILQL